MFQAIDICPLKTESFSRAGAALIEVGTVSLISEYMRIPSTVFLGIVTATDELGPKDKAWKHVSFYTAALNDSIEAMVECAAFGRKFTPHLKIKLDGNVSRCASVLKALDAWSVKHEQISDSHDAIG